MMGSDELQPKDAIILQNKDDVIIPLLLNELPSAKEFKDAVQSLSPEQRRFAEAFRSMQLSSSVFGVAVIQIKPQLERLLGLPEDSLAKEIKLTQDLMELFVEHQVPSDLLSYDGETSDSVTSKEKVDNIRTHVESVLGVINSEKENQLEQATMKADMAAESAVASGLMFGSPVPPPMIGGGPAFAFGAAAPAPVSEAIRSSLKSCRRASLSAALPSPGFISASSAGQQQQQHSATNASPGGDDSTPSGQSLSGSKRRLPESQKVQKIGGDQSRGGESSSVLNFSAIPGVLDRTFLKFDKESALRSTVIKTAKTWTRKRQENLLKKPTSSTLSSDAIRSETNSAFDLLDALSRSGSLSIPYSELHVVLCVSHCFQKSVSDTVIQDNVNPIEKLELSTLLLGSVIHGTEPYQLVTAGTERQRIESTFPALSDG